MGTWDLPSMILKGNELYPIVGTAYNVPDLV